MDGTKREDRDLRADLELARARGRVPLTEPGAAIEAWTWAGEEAAWEIAESACRRAIEAEEEVERLRAEVRLRQSQRFGQPED